MHEAETNALIQSLHASARRWRAAAVASWLVILLGALTATYSVATAHQRAERARQEATRNFELARAAVDAMYTEGAQKRQKEQKAQLAIQVPDEPRKK